MRYVLSTALATVVAVLAFAIPADAAPAGGVTAGTSTSPNGGNQGTGSTGGGVTAGSGGSASAGGGQAPSGAPNGGSAVDPGTAPNSGGSSFDPSWVPSGADGGTAPGSAPVTPVNPTPTATTGGAFARRDIPAEYVTLYKAAAKKYGINWTILAAIGKNETDHGRARLPGVADGMNFAECCAGPMQICMVKSCGNVWQAYAIDANGNGTISIYEPADAVDAAAHLVADLQRIVGKNTKLILAAYNAGPGNVQKYRGIPPFSETVKYVNNGVRYIRKLRK